MRWWLIPLIMWPACAEAAEHPLGMQGEFNAYKPMERLDIVACRTIESIQTFALRILTAGAKRSDEAIINAAVAATNAELKSTACVFFKNAQVGIVFVETEWHTSKGSTIKFYRVLIDPGGSYLIARLVR